MTITAKSEEQPFAKVGVLGADPELAFGASGVAYCKFSLAWAPYPNPDKETVWYTVTCFGTLAENAANSLVKGNRVAVIGRGHMERWESEDGKQGISKEVLADAVGPDLRFATADIHKIARRTPPAARTAPPPAAARDAEGKPLAVVGADGQGSQDNPFSDEPF